MHRAPSYSLLGPALLLYLMADAAAAQGQLDGVGAFTAVCAALLATVLTALLRNADAERPGALRVGALGLFAACALPRLAAPQALSLVAELSHVLSLSACAALVVDLALSVPDRLGRPQQTRLWRSLGYSLATLGAVAAAGAFLPALRVRGHQLLASTWFAELPALLFACALWLALGLRLVRPRLGSTPEALASNTWAVLGLLPSAVVVPLLVALPWLPKLPGGDAEAWLRGGMAATSLWLVFGHLRLIDPSRRLGVGRATREGTAALLTLGSVAAACLALAPLWPSGYFAAGSAIAAALLCAAALQRGLSRLAHSLLAPAGGRLLRALERAHAELTEARDLQGVAAIGLRAARAATGTSEAEPFLYLFDPQREYRLDAASQPHESERPASAEITRALRAQQGELIVRAPLERNAVREPVQRPLLAALEAADALCVLPLGQFGELEGMLIFPRGGRAGSLTLEELEALRGFGRHLSGFLCVLSSEARSERRASLLLAKNENTGEALALARDEMARVEGELRALRTGSSTRESQLIAYSESMRGVMRRLRHAAEADSPLLFVAERGLPLTELAQRLHRDSARAAEPFLIGECAGIRAEHGEQALFGGEDAALGWVTLVANGSLLLADLPALSLSAQRALAAAMQPGPNNNFRARLLASCRRDPDELVAAGALAPELRERFGNVLRVPPLRECVEDLPSLILLALDRSARRLGRAAPGLDPSAQAQLLAHAWPGNQDELEAVIELAVARAEGTRVLPADLPTLGPVAPQKNPLDGTLVRVERRVLQRALERTAGNKSEAARLLGLKRTTFLDKLRRHDLDDGSKPPGASEAAN